MYYSEPNEVALSELASEKSEESMTGKRKAAERNGVPRNGAGRGADSAMSCPVIAAIRAAQPQRITITRTTITTASSSV